MFGPYDAVNSQSKVKGATRKTTWGRLYFHGDDRKEGKDWWACRGVLRLVGVTVSFFAYVA